MHAVKTAEDSCVWESCKDSKQVQSQSQSQNQPQQATQGEVGEDYGAYRLVQKGAERHK
jgi:hypothetical protein